MKLVCCLLCVLVLGGCRTWDRRDSAWDPPVGSVLFDQIPNETGGAMKHCGGHLPEDQRIREARSGRC